MTVSVKEMIDQWVSLTGWGGGASVRPTKSTSPTITQLLDWMTHAEHDALLSVTEQRRGTSLITTEAGKQTYTDITDNLPRSWLEARIRTSTTGAWRELPYVEWSALNRMHPDWINTSKTGIPRCFTVSPVTGSVSYCPVPDGAYTVEHHYRHRLQRLALPADPVWFLYSVELPEDANDSITIETGDTDWRADHVDRPRKLICQADNYSDNHMSRANGGEPYRFLVFYTLETGVETSGWMTVDAEDPTAHSYSESLVTGVSKVTLPGHGDTGVSHYLNLGIGDWFSEPDGEAPPAVDICRSASHLPDEWALRIAPFSAALRWAERVGDQALAAAMRAAHAENLARFVKAHSTVSATRIRLFGGGWPRWATVNRSVWR